MGCSPSESANGFKRESLVHKIDPEKLHDLICDEFDIPEDFQFIIDEHWNLGHGWPERDNLLDPKAKVFVLDKDKSDASENVV